MIALFTYNHASVKCRSLWQKYFRLLWYRQYSKKVESYWISKVEALHMAMSTVLTLIWLLFWNWLKGRLVRRSRKYGLTPPVYARSCQANWKVWCSFLIVCVFSRCGVMVVGGVCCTVRLFLRFLLSIFVVFIFQWFQYHVRFLSCERIMFNQGYCDPIATKLYCYASEI